MSKLHRSDVDFDTLLDAVDQHFRYVAGRSRAGCSDPVEGDILVMPSLDGGPSRWRVDFLQYPDPQISPSFVGGWVAIADPAPPLSLALVA